MNRAGMATAAILIAGWCAALAVSWPGHLSYDSIVQLHDGAAGFYHSWHPPVMAWMLGLLGPGGFIALNAALSFGALLLLLRLKPRASWLAAGAAAVMVLLPQLILYQAIVWKDVLFADAAVAGFVCLTQGQARSARIWIAAAFALFALAALARQNGLVVLVFGALALALDRKFLTAGVALAGAAALMFAASFALSLHSDRGEGPVAQLKLLRLYDLVGAVAADPSLPLDRLKQSAPDLEELIRTDGVRLYSPQRNDTLAGSSDLQDELADAPPELMAAQWNDLVLRHTWLYLKTRARVFAWVFFTPDGAACRPVFVGVEGPPGEMGDLGLAPRQRPRDLALANYSKAFMGTPVLSHAAYAILALAATVLLLRRRAPGDLAIACMLMGAFAFAASFFVISIACDYRYLYYLDLAALAATFHVALDPAYLFHVLAMWVGSSWLDRSADRKS